MPMKRCAADNNIVTRYTCDYCMSDGPTLPAGHLGGRRLITVHNAAQPDETSSIYIDIQTIVRAERKQ